jgi:hypothetical protein
VKSIEQFGFVNPVLIDQTVSSQMVRPYTASISMNWPWNVSGTLKHLNSGAASEKTKA